MAFNYLTQAAIGEFISAALCEDIGNGDHSTLSCIPEHAVRRAHLKVKTAGILAGVGMAVEIFNRFDPGLKTEILIPDGSLVKIGDIAFTVEGSARSILTTERLVLNCMQRMSGIATVTNRLASIISDTGALLLDTRKTTPCFRLAEKWAVAIGGGTNHRFGLFDKIMLKDNHIDFAGGIPQAVAAAKEYLDHNKLSLQIEVETRNLTEVKQALEAGVDRIMFDNMTTEQTRDGVALVAGACETEASGNITEIRIREVALTGVNFISVGALTHSAPILDLSLKAY